MMLRLNRLLLLSGNSRNFAPKWLYIRVCGLPRGLLDAHLMLAMCSKKSPPEFLYSGGDLIVVFEAVQRCVYLLDYYRGFIKVFFCNFGIFKLVKEFYHLIPKHFVSPRTALDYNITLERSVYQIRLLCLTRNSGQNLNLLVFLWRYPKGYCFAPPTIFLVQILL